MVNPQQQTVETSKQTVADHGDVNVTPYSPSCLPAAQARSRQLSPMPQVPPLAR
jgi:hypothetical protein